MASFTIFVYASPLNRRRSRAPDARRRNDPMRKPLMAGMALTLITLSGCGPEATKTAEAPAPAPAAEIKMTEPKTEAALPSAQAQTQDMAVELDTGAQAQTDDMKVTLNADTEDQVSNRNELFDLLNLPAFEGEVPFMTKELANGEILDIWPGPMMGDAEKMNCRFVMVGDLRTRRVDQSFPACREAGADWLTTYDPAALGAAEREVITAAFGGTMPAFGPGIDPFAAK